MPNHLIHESSPYLLQHAHNPVDWFAWSEETFEKARIEDKPVFLSIGYATCHWCHVMEHESFEDVEIAAAMNEAFVCIKVDREERPDIDGVYMTVCQMMNGNGGWPLNVLLTPDKKPFFAATYIPKYTRYNRLGMTDLVEAISNAWKSERSKIMNSADYLTGLLQETTQNASPDATGLGEADLLDAYRQLAERFDPENGGFGYAPKFPSPHNLLFLLQQYKRTQNPMALEMVIKTLDAMRLGGIFDHVGFGFHRYATDATWFLPHFEKMLYDQAMLMMAYTEAYQVTKKTEYAQTVREIAEYILRDMTNEKGGFYSAEDADSEGEEGKFYVWEMEELTKIGMDESLRTMFNATDEGNAYDEATQESIGANILHLASPLSLEQQEIWKKVRKKLFETRKKRIHPLKDDKVLTDWNGLMIAAFAKAGCALNEPIWIEAAEKAIRFIRHELIDTKGRLIHRWRNGNAGLQANLDDYAFVIWGNLELYQATLKTTYLEQALILQEHQLTYFWDATHHGFFFTPDDGETLIVREKPIYDGAIPSGNAVSFHNLSRLSKLLKRIDFHEKAEQMRKAFTTDIRRSLVGYTFWMCALESAETESQELILVGDLTHENVQNLLQNIRSEYFPNLTVLYLDQNAPLMISFLPDFPLLENKPTAYLCQNFVCQMPTTKFDILLNELINN